MLEYEHYRKAVDDIADKVSDLIQREAIACDPNLELPAAVHIACAVAQRIAASAIAGNLSEEGLRDGDMEEVIETNVMLLKTNCEAIKRHRLGLPYREGDPIVSKKPRQETSAWDDNNNA